VFWVISVYFNLRNTLPKFGTFLLGHPVCINAAKFARDVMKYLTTERISARETFLESVSFGVDEILLPIY